jgi:4-hydroxy-2-oxoheptanedioate aldolase
MANSTRLNGVIRALESGKPAFTSFSSPDTASALSFATSNYDAVVFEMEHNPWNAETLRDCLQYMLIRKQIADSGSVAPAVAPMVRVPRLAACRHG